jgi:hypothetical protein
MAKESIKKLQEFIKNQRYIQSIGVLGENHSINPKN